MTAGTWQSFGLAGLRGLALVLAAGAVGFALASLGRHAAMAMGTAIASIVVGWPGSRSVRRRWCCCSAPRCGRCVAAT